jgi:pre-rRNA-processing protein TSR4
MGFEHWDGGKIGGRPFHLNPRHPISRKADNLFCQACPDSPPLQFLMQIYAPADDVSEQAFHRMLYVFVCTTPGCDSAQCVRAQLPEANGFHGATNQEVRSDASKTLPRGYGHEDLCGVCGLKADGSRCPKQEMFFCSRAHQKDYMKNVTKRIMADEKEGVLAGMFEEFALEVYEDESDGEADEAYEAEREKREIEKMEELNAKLAKTAVNSDFSGINNDDDDDDDKLDDDLEQKGESGLEDPVTARFMENIKKHDDQCLRYSRWCSDALEWTSSEHQPSSIPCCENCGSERKFEFQITPQILSFLKVDLPAKAAPSKKGFLLGVDDVDGAVVTKLKPGSADDNDDDDDAAPNPEDNPLNKLHSKVDFGTVAVYTCSKSCALPAAANGKEFCWSQPGI